MKQLSWTRVLAIGLVGLGVLLLKSRGSAGGNRSGEPEGYKDPPGGKTRDPDESLRSGEEPLEEPEGAPGEPEGYKDPPGGKTRDPDESLRSGEEPLEEPEGAPGEPEGYKDPPGGRPKPPDPAELA